MAAAFRSGSRAVPALSDLTPAKLGRVPWSSLGKWVFVLSVGAILARGDSVMALVERVVSGQAVESVTLAGTDWSAVTDRIEETGKSIDSISHEMEARGRRLADLEESKRDHDKQLTSIAATLKEISADVRLTREDVARIRGQLDADARGRR